MIFFFLSINTQLVEINNRKFIYTMFIRVYANTLKGRLLEPRHFIQVVIGPRQVGKTTALHQILPGIGMPNIYATADLPGPPDANWIIQQWQEARSFCSGSNSVAILVLDEIQKVKDWSTTVKRLWDEDTAASRDIRVVILGSSSLLIQRGLEESLAGRFELVRFPHWSFEECRTCFACDLDRFIFFGGYPGGWAIAEDEARWTQYIRDSLIETAIAKDVLLMNRVDKPALLRQLFVLACEYGSQILSYQKIQGQLTDAGNTTTLAGYQRLLESAFLIRGLQKWAGGALHRRNSSPKWQPLNTALMTALSGRTFDQWKASPEHWGCLVETAIGANLINSSAFDGIEVYYWRQGNAEVDYVLAKGGKLIGIEVKSGARKISPWGLKEFQKDFPGARTVVIGSGGVSIEEALLLPAKAWF